MRRLSIRWKLTLWYGGVLAAVLLVFGVAIYLTMGYQLIERIDQGLAEELSDVRSEIRRASNARSLREWLDRRFASHAGFDFQITLGNGERFFVSERLVATSLPEPKPGADMAAITYETNRVARSGWRVITERVTGPDGPLNVQIGRSLSAYDHEQSELLTTLLITGPLTLLLAVAGGYYLARRALLPVQSMARTADQITAERLSTRVPVPNPHDELGELARTLNGMIERLERSFVEMQRFTADAAHELRTPLAVIRNEAEVALRSPRSTDEYGRVLENVLLETVRLSRLADELLFLCRQDAGLNQQETEAVPLCPLLEEVVGNMRPVAQEKGVVLTTDIADGHLVTADARQLRRVFYNLIDNAVKYTPAQGQVHVRCSEEEGQAIVSVSDTGTGIPTEHLPRIFDRFYRADPSRTGDENGAGLGLSICQSVVRSVGGSIAVSSQPSKGTEFRVSLPATPAM